MVGNQGLGARSHAFSSRQGRDRGTDEEQRARAARREVSGLVGPFAARRETIRYLSAWHWGRHWAEELLDRSEVENLHQAQQGREAGIILAIHQIAHGSREIAEPRSFERRPSHLGGMEDAFDARLDRGLGGGRQLIPRALGRHLRRFAALSELVRPFSHAAPRSHAEKA